MTGARDGWLQRLLVGRDSSLAAHYYWAAHHGGTGMEANMWTATATVLWSAFCLQWVAIAWCALVGKEQHDE